MNARNFLDDLINIRSKSNRFLKDDNFEKHVDYYQQIKAILDQNIELFQQINQKIDSSSKNIICNNYDLVVTINLPSDESTSTDKLSSLEPNNNILNNNSTESSIDNNNSKNEKFGNLLNLNTLNFVKDYEQILREKDDLSKEKTEQVSNEQTTTDNKLSPINQNESSCELEKLPDQLSVNDQTDELNDADESSRISGKQLIDKYLNETLDNVDSEFSEKDFDCNYEDESSSPRTKSVNEDDLGFLSDVSDSSLVIIETNVDNNLTEKVDPIVNINSTEKIDPTINNLNDDSNDSSISNPEFNTLEDFFETSQNKQINEDKKDKDRKDNDLKDKESIETLEDFFETSQNKQINEDKKDKDGKDNDRKDKESIETLEDFFETSQNKQIDEDKKDNNEKYNGKYRKKSDDKSSQKASPKSDKNESSEEEFDLNIDFNKKRTDNEKFNENKGEEFDLNIDFNKKRTENKKLNENKENFKNSDHLQKSTNSTEFKILEDDYEVPSEPESVFSTKSIQSFKSTNSTFSSKTESLKKREPFIKIKTKNFEIRLVRLTERLIELASRNAKKAAIEINRYEAKVMRTLNQGYDNFDYSKIGRSTDEFCEQPSTSTDRRFNFNFDFDSEESSSSKRTSKKSSAKKKCLDETSSSSSDIFIRKKSKNKRKAFFSSSEDEETLSYDSIDEDDNFSISSNEEENKPKKVIKKKLKVDDLYSSDDEESNSGYNSLEEDFIQITKVVENETKKTTVIDEDKENEVKIVSSPKIATPSSKLTSIKTTKVNNETINHQNNLPENPKTNLLNNRLNNQQSTAVIKKKFKSKSKRKNEIVKILNTKDLRIETRKESRNEIERIKRIVTINSRFETLNNLNELNNDQSVILEYDKNGSPLVQIDKILAGSFKKHQKEGVRFLYMNTVESIEVLARNEGKGGHGSILGHNQGLGKTFQIISFVHCLLNNNLTKDYFKTALILCPINVVENWFSEVKKWIYDKDLSLPVSKFSDCKSYFQKTKMFQDWKTFGGLMLISHQMFSRLITSKEDDEPADFSNLIEEIFLDPGPDLVIVDEGHTIKNDKGQLNESLSRIKTKRRIVLSGTPLQNNLKEYFVMCDFVRPYLLGDSSEFSTNFVKPIAAGQHEDSSPAQVKLMKKRIHVLQEFLKYVIHRVGYNVLQQDLKPKYEYVIKIKLSPIQEELYTKFLSITKNAKDIKDLEDRNFFYRMHIFKSIYNHPLILKSGKSAEKDWYEEILRKETNLIDLSSKIKVFLFILKHCEKNGEKLVVFSQDLVLLDLIEEIIKKEGLNRCMNPLNFKNQYKSFKAGVDYFRIDGSTNTSERQNKIDIFNNPEQKQIRLFLLTTKACSLGINLIGANRCIIFDASWNPCSDVQAIFRTYRYGQTKEVFVYRFIASGTAEDKIYAQQIQKQSLSNRILDDTQSKRIYKLKDVMRFYEYNPPQRDPNHVHNLPKDPLLAELLKEQSDLLVDYHEHNSLLEHCLDDDLTDEERKQAWEEWEKTKNRIEQLQNNKLNNVQNAYLNTLGLKPNLNGTTTANQQQQYQQNINLSNTNASSTSNQQQQYQQNINLSNTNASSTAQQSNNLSNQKRTTSTSLLNEPIPKLLKTNSNPIFSTPSTGQESGKQHPNNLHSSFNPTTSSDMNNLSKKISSSSQTNSDFSILKNLISNPITTSVPTNIQFSDQQPQNNNVNFSNAQFNPHTQQTNFSNQTTYSSNMNSSCSTNNLKFQTFVNGQSFTTTPNEQPQMHGVFFVTPTFKDANQPTKTNLNSAGVNQPNVYQTHINQQNSNLNDFTQIHVNKQSDMNYSKTNINRTKPSPMNQPPMNQPTMNQPTMNQPPMNQPRMNQYNFTKIPKIPKTKTPTMNFRKGFLKNLNNNQNPQMNFHHQQKQNNPQTNFHHHQQQQEQQQRQQQEQQQRQQQEQQQRQQQRQQQQQQQQRQKVTSTPIISRPKFYFSDISSEIYKTALKNVKELIRRRETMNPPLVGLDIHTILKETLDFATKKKNNSKNPLDIATCEQEEKIIQDFMLNRPNLLTEFPHFKNILEPKLNEAVKINIDELD